MKITIDGCTYESLGSTLNYQCQRCKAPCNATGMLYVKLSQQSKEYLCFRCFRKELKAKTDNSEPQPTIYRAVSQTTSSPKNTKERPKQKSNYQHRDTIRERSSVKGIGYRRTEWWVPLSLPFANFACECGSPDFRAIETSIMTSLRCCNCNKEYQIPTAFISRKKHAYWVDQSRFHLSEPKLSAHDVITRVNVFHCTKNGHALEDIVCHMPVVKTGGSIVDVKTPGGYCPQCDKYFILETDYAAVQAIGDILCRVISIIGNSGKDHVSSVFDFFDMESVMHRAGYNVNAQNNLPQTYRWNKLESLVNHGILTKMEICSHLDNLINRNRNIARMERAVKKWTTDRAHIKQFSPKPVPEIEVISIRARPI